MACFAFGRVQYGFNFYVTSNVFISLAIRLHDITLLKTVIRNCCTYLWGTIRLISIMRQTVLREGDCYYLVMSFCILKTFSIPADSYFKTFVQMSPNKVLISPVIIRESQNAFCLTSEGGCYAATGVGCKNFYFAVCCHWPSLLGLGSICLLLNESSPLKLIWKQVGLGWSLHGHCDSCHFSWYCSL